MLITSTGHAGLYIETAGGSILCDPWFTPAYFGSWHVFPRQDTLDVERISRPDYLYISHSHRDHLDLEWLDAHVDTAAVVLLPEFAIDQLEAELRSVGFERFVHTRDCQPVHLAEGLDIAILALSGPNIGPMGDSALMVADPTATILNQNDAHPHEIPTVAGFEHFDGHFLQHSGAIWHPMVYDLDDREMASEIRKSRARRHARASDYVAMVGAHHVFPTAGPPCFLDEELFEFNDLPGHEPTIFPDATVFIDALREQGVDAAHLLIPGSVARLEGADCTVEHPVATADVERIFSDKEVYLRGYQRAVAPAIDAERASWPTARTDLLAGLQAWLDPLLAKAPRTRQGVGGVIGLDLGDVRVAIDMPAGRVRPWDPDEQPPYVFEIPRPLAESLVERRVPDWCNEIFLSCRFRAHRTGPYNEAVYTFFKSLDRERMAYAERYYAADPQRSAGEDWVVVDGWEVQARCPHQGASLRRVGSVSDGVLTCGLHGWRFDLETGECLDADGVCLRVRGRS